MNGSPHPDYLAQIHATLGGGPAPTQPVMLGQRPMVPPPVAPPPPEPIMSPKPPPDPNMNLASTPAPPPPPPPAPPPPPKPQPFLQAVAGGVYNQPAKETELRGPSLRAAQGNRNEAFEGAVQAVNERSQATAAADYAVALDEERKAGIRADAADHVAAERADEMAQRQADFEQSAKTLGEAGRLDPNRFWSSQSTGQKVGNLISVMIGGLVSQFTGGRNLAMESVNTAINNDIKAQEFAYNATRDTVNAKQTAFSMAMQKFNNVDQARAAARAAALDVASARVAQQAALWKGTESANKAQIAWAQLQDEKANQIAQGVAYAPARQVGIAPSYIGPGGLRYTEQEAKGLVAKEGEREFQREQKGTDVAGQLLVEGAKAGQKNGDTINAETRAISTQLQQAGVPQARANAETAKKALNASPGGRVEAAVRGGLPDGLARALYSDDANAREDAYNDFMNAAIKATAGNATASEEVRVARSMGSTADPKARNRAIDRVLNTLAEVEKGAKAGASPAAQAAYDERRQNAEGAPPAAPKGSKAGW